MDDFHFLIQKTLKYMTVHQDSKFVSKTGNASRRVPPQSGYFFAIFWKGRGYYFQLSEDCTRESFLTSHSAAVSMLVSKGPPLRLRISIAQDSPLHGQKTV